MENNILSEKLGSGKFFSGKMLSSPYIVWAAIFIIVPLGMVFYYGLTDKTGAFTLENIAAIMSAEHAKALWISLGLSLISTAICFFLAYPLAMILANMNVSQHSFIVLIFILPMWMNFLLRTLAWQTLLEKTGVINNILSFLHLPALNIINTPYAIVLGMVYNFLPFMVLPIYNSLVKIDLTTFVISKLLGGSKILLIGNVIEEEFTQAGNWHLGSGLSIVLMIFIIVNMVVSAIFDKDGEGSFL